MQALDVGDPPRRPVSTMRFKCVRCKGSVTYRRDSRALAASSASIFYVRPSSLLFDFKQHIHVTILMIIQRCSTAKWAAIAVLALLSLSSLLHFTEGSATNQRQQAAKPDGHQVGR